MVRLTSKPVIQKIKLSKEEQDEVNKILKGEPVQITYHYRGARGHIIERVRNKQLTREVAKKRLTELLGGKCTGCGIAWPAYKVMHNVGDKNQGAWLVQRYCDSCYDKRGYNKK